VSVAALQEQEQENGILRALELSARLAALEWAKLSPAQRRHCAHDRHILRGQSYNLAAKAAQEVGGPAFLDVQELVRSELCRLAQEAEAQALAARGTPVERALRRLGADGLGRLLWSLERAFQAEREAQGLPRSRSRFLSRAIRHGAQERELELAWDLLVALDAEDAGR